MRPAAHQIFVAGLVVLGALEPVGSLSASSWLHELGRLTFASNSPLVFNEVGGVEFWANRYRIEFHDRSGAKSDLPITREVVSRIQGPHTRRAAYVVPLEVHFTFRQT